MPSRDKLAEVLANMPVKDLKKEIRKTNITGYSKMKKLEIVELMLKHRDRFKHVVPKGYNPHPGLLPSNINN